MSHIPGAEAGTLTAGSFTITIPGPPAFPPVEGAALPPFPVLADPAELGDPGAPAPPAAYVTSDPEIVLGAPAPPAGLLPAAVAPPPPPPALDGTGPSPVPVFPLLP